MKLPPEPQTPSVLQLIQWIDQPLQRGQENVR